MKTRVNQCCRVALLIFACLALAASPTYAQNAADDYAQAANHYARGNWSESISAFNVVIKRYPTTGEAVLARFYLAEVMMQRSEFGQAYLAFQIFLRENPRHEYVPRATFRMGEAAYRTQNRDVAIRLFEKFIRKNPDHSLTEFALPYLGEMRLKQDEPQLAQRAFETALRIFPASSISNKSRLGLGKSLQRLGNDAEAVRFFEFLLTQGDQELVGESNLQLGIMSFGKSDFQSAQQFLSQAIKKCQTNESSSEATYWLARTFNATQSHQRALELLSSIVERDLPEHLAVAALFDGAVAATKTGDDELALQWLARLRERFPKNALVDDALKMSIDLHQKRGETKRMLALIREFRIQHRHSPMRASVLDTEGRAQYAAKQYGRMIETFATLIEENDAVDSSDHPSVADWHYLKSLGHLGLGDYEGAERELASIDPFRASDQLAQWVPIARATAQYGLEDYANATRNYRLYLESSALGAEQKRARAELVICLAETGQWDEVASAFDELKRNHPHDPLVLSTATYLAELLFHENEYSRAERWFVLMAQPDNPQETVEDGLAGLAWINIKSKATRSTNELFERFLTEFPDSKRSRESAMARAKFLEDEGELESAAQTYRLVVGQPHPSAMKNIAKLRLAYVLQKIGGRVNLAECETLLRDYLVLPSGNPLSDEAQYQLGWVLRDLGRADEGLAQFAELVESDPASKYWADAAYRVIQDAVENQDFETAKPLVARTLDCLDVPPPVMARVLFAQGQIAAAENDWADVTDSMEHLASTTDDESIQVLARYWLAESFYRTQKYAEALKIFGPLVAVVDRIDDSLEPWVMLRAAQCYGFDGNWYQASEIADRAQEKFEDFEAGYEFTYVRGRGLEDAGKLVDARDVYQSVVESERGGSTETAAMAQWRIGETFFHQEDYVNAIKSYHKVDALFSYQHWRSAALFQAGKCQELLNNQSHAIKLYTQLVDSFPDSEFASGARERLDYLTAQANASSKNKSRSRPAIGNRR